MADYKKKIQNFFSDKVLFGVLLTILIVHYGNVVSFFYTESILIFVACVATVPVLGSAYRSLKNKKISVDLLAGVALLVSLLNKEWASATFINLMLTSARIFDAYTENRAKNAIKSLLKLRPDTVKVKRGEKIIVTPITGIQKGDLIVVELGERIAVDGIVVSGQAQIDQSSLTGESFLVDKAVGDEVLSSTLNMSGSLVIRAEKVGQDTIFEKVVQLVAQSQQEKASIQTIADKFAGWYIGLSFLLAIGVYIFTRDVRIVLSMLLVTCADDIAVAIPMAFSAGIAQAAKRGIIVKGGAFLEGLTQVKTLIVDKTGTLTKGRLKVSRVCAFGGKIDAEVVALAASVDFFSTHPVAQAVIRYAEEKKITFEKTEEFEEHSGMGSHAILFGKKIVCGKIDFLVSEGVAISDKQNKEIERIKSEGSSSLLPIAYDGQLIGLILLEDEVREEAKGALAQLKLLGVENIVMLTGDTEKVAEKVSSELGITTYHANLLPEDKLRYVKQYINPNHKVAMIGDGVNDAASLALADIGIAMGVMGADAAIEAADVALMKDDLTKVGEVVELGQAVTAISRQDFWIWGTVNVIGLVLVFSKVIGPEGAAAYNFLTDFIPLINSIRMFGYRQADFL